MDAEKSRIRDTVLSLLRDAQSYLKETRADKVPNSALAMAWNEFYIFYDELIRRFVVGQGAPLSDVDDCVQEVWIEVLLRLESFDRPPGRPGLRSWLYSLVRSKTVDVYRLRHRRAEISVAGSIEQAEDPRQVDPVTLYEAQWQAALLESVISQLQSRMSKTSYRILQMRLTEGRDNKEVALALKLRPEQVRYRYHRAKQKLRAHLARLTGERAGASE